MASRCDIGRLMKCVNFCAVKHTNQRRKDSASTPYINHPIGVAHILTNEAGVNDETVILAALLHDTVEDTDTSLQEIQAEFGEKVASIVKEVTDDKSLPYHTRKELQVEHAAGSSFEAKLVKLADKLYNLRDLVEETPVGWTQQRVDDYFTWASRVIQGLRGTNAALEKQLDLVLNHHNNSK